MEVVIKKKDNTTPDNKYYRVSYICMYYGATTVQNYSYFYVTYYVIF